MTSREQLKKFLLNAAIPDIPPKELASYIDAHLDRLYYMYVLFVQNTKLGVDLNILDSGAKPYILTAMLLHETEAEITGLGYTIDPLPAKPTQYVCSQPPKHTKIKIGEKSFDMHQANLEMDTLPFENETFTTVFCTETMEHLTFDPSFMLFQLNRVLATDGLLFFSVPNALYWPRLLQLMFGKNIDDPYSHHGPGGRHNRLFTLKELKDIMKGHGFTVVSTSQKTFYPESYSLFKRLAGKFGDFLFGLSQKKGRTNILVLKKSSSVSEPYRPDWLYH